MIVETVLFIVCVLLLLMANISERRIDGVHKRISLTTQLNGLRDPWREAEERKSPPHEKAQP